WLRGELLGVHSAGGDRDIRKGFQERSIEGDERQVLTCRQLDEQRVVHRDLGLVGANQGRLPQRSVRNRVNAQGVGQRQAAGGFVDRQDVVTRRHPERVGELG